MKLPVCNIAAALTPTLAALVLLFCAPWASAATTPTPATVAGRILGKIDDSARIELAGHVHPALRGSRDLGEVDPALRADRLTLVLRASPQQDAALENFLRDVHDPASAQYRKWLTPQVFAQRYGVAPADLAKLQGWLKSKGFRVDEIPAGGRSIVFSGTVGQLNRAFGTSIHSYSWRGEHHLASSNNPSIPAAIAPVVRGFASLHDFRHRPSHAGGVIAPDFTSGTSHYLAPGDYATIYDIGPVYAASVSGAGHSIAVLGRSAVVQADLDSFHQQFGLALGVPTILNNGPAPGRVGGDELESDLDLEWSSAVAPGATIKFVTSASTSLSDGIDLSAQYAVSNNVADVISLSYSSCEAAADVSGGALPHYHQLWQQAAAQGMSVFVSSGDSGAANCDAAGSATATQGAAVNQLCSSPYSTCVGGSQFNADVASPSTYWSASNAANQSSALSYIGEEVWNQSGTQAGGTALWASGGGASRYFAKPSWQYAPGVPSDGLRDVPDLALSASSHDAYLIFTSQGYSQSTEVGVYGTSAATPSMAGIAALLAQKAGGRVGNINPVLYALSDQQAAGGLAVFHRITTGDNSVPGQAGYGASVSDPGFNLATGLGSVDVAQLASAWNTVSAPPAGLSPGYALVPAALFEGSATLTLPSNMSWTASSNAAWLSASPISGSGASALTFIAQPNAGTARSGIITINGMTLTIEQASGIAAAAAQISLSSSALTFGNDPVGNASTRQRILVGNNGGAILTLASVGITGAQSTDFAASGSCAAAIAINPGASCYLDVRFTPAATGIRSATLQLAWSAGNASVTLSGTGTAATAATGDVPLPPWAIGAISLALAASLLRPARSTVRRR